MVNGDHNMTTAQKRGDEMVWTPLFRHAVRELNR